MLEVILLRCPQLHLHLNYIQEYSIMTVTESSTGPPAENRAGGSMGHTNRNYN